MTNTTYTSVVNRPIPCSFCGAQVQGQVNQIPNSATRTTENICRWVCARCGNLVKMGKVS